MKTINGACQCKKTTFEIEHETSYKPPVMICHCTDCQRLSGGFSTYNISFPLSSITWTGLDPGKYEQAGDSGTVNTKVFCKQCGSTMATLASKRGLAIIKVPMLGEHIKEYDITPQFEQYVRSKFACEPERYAPSSGEQYDAMKTA